MTDHSLIRKHNVPFASTVQIVVGQEEVCFKIHPFVLRGTPLHDFANKTPDENGVILRLPDDSPKAFDNYMYWLYKQRDAHEKEKLRDFHMILFQTHVLAQRLGDTKTANRIMDWIARVWRVKRHKPGPMALAYLFGESVEKSSPLRIWAAECYGPDVPVARFDALGEGVPKEFLSLVARHLRRCAQDPRWASPDLSRYHLVESDIQPGWTRRS